MKSGRWKSHIILLKIKRLSGRPVSYTHLKVSIEVAIEQHDTETTIPYLHVFLDNMWDLRNCAFVRLDKPEYVPEKNSIRLSTKQKEELIYILTSESKYHWTTSIVDKNNIKIATGYEVAVQVWTDTYEENNKKMCIRDSSFRI